MILHRVSGLVAATIGAACAAVAADGVLFRDAASGAGLRFQHVNGATGLYYLPEIMGAGGALFDLDGDGDLDVLLLQGGALDEKRPGSPAPPGHRLFRNDLAASSGGPKLEFTDVTDRAGLVAGDYGMGAAVGDYDNDGDPDVYVTNYGPNRLYRNNGDGTLTDVTRAAGEGLDDRRWSTSASFCDYDADGDLDLFVANYVDFTVADNKICHDPVGLRDYCGPLQFRPMPDRLFRNNGDGSFTDVSDAAGMTKADGPGLGVVCADFNGDGRSDFYVANDAMANQLWINQGDGRFEDTALLAGAALNVDGVPEGSMGLAVGDPDDDGDLDIVVTNITRETHAFYRNLGRGHFEDVRLAAGLGAATAPYTGFGTDWFDYDNDGRLDLFIANGAVTILEALRGDPFPFHQKNQLFQSVGGGRFRDVTGEAGPAFQVSEVSRGAAFGDVDNDGDVDVLVTNNGGPARLLLNQSLSPNSPRDPRIPRLHWLQVRLEGVEDNRQGLGARVGLLRKDGTTVWRWARTDGSYLSASDPRVHFGLGKQADFQAVFVEWPRGLREVWTDLGADRVAVLKQGTGTKRP
jgi:hypothetical protein